MTSKVFFLITVLTLAANGASGGEGLTPACAGSLHIGSFRLLVEPATGGAPLPLFDVNMIQPGEKLRYEPVHIAPAIKDKARIALLLVPASPAHLQDEGQDRGEGRGGDQDIEVLDAQPARDSAQWVVPARTAVVGLVFGPHGLDVKKVSSLVAKNPEVIAELTEYADQTAKVGALVTLLSEYEQAPDPNRSLEAALQGFSTQYNVAIPKLDTTAPPNQQAAQMLRALVPSLNSYDPLTSTPTAAVAQTAGLAGAVATLFFGTPVGLVAGGAALFLNMRTLMFPDTDFRSAIVQPQGAKGLALCASKEPEKARTRVAYLWMMRVPDAPAPVASLAETAYVPMGGKCTLKVPCAKPADSRLLLRARAWELASATHRVEVPVKVEVGPAADSLELDLTHAKLPAGEYRLAAMWDWAPFQVAGKVDVRPLGDFSRVKIATDSADRLVEGSGLVKVQLNGADFEFVEKVILVKAGDKKAQPKELSFTLPEGKAQGEQQSLEAEVDTSALGAGSYHLTLTQNGAADQVLSMIVHPPNPKLENLPWRVNLGEPQQTVTLRGTGLERLARLTSPEATWELAPARPEALDLTERPATIKLRPAAHQGELISASLFVEEVQAPLEIPGVLQVAGPRPKIVGISKSFAQESDVRLREGEIPAGSAVSIALRAENLETRPQLSLACANEGYAKQPLSLRSGERTGASQLESAGEGLLFLSLDPGVVGQSGCQLSATITGDSGGNSDAFALGRIIRLPRLAKFTLAEQKLGELYAGMLTGQDLQMIEKTGWDGKTGFPVQGIPTPVPGSPQEQTLEVALPWPPPSPHAPVYVWLRGEGEGRLTNAKY